MVADTKTYTSSGNTIVNLIRLNCCGNTVKCDDLVTVSKEIMRSKATRITMLTCCCSGESDMDVLRSVCDVLCLWVFLSLCLWEGENRNAEASLVPVTYNDISLALNSVRQNEQRLWCFFMWLNKLVVLFCGTDTSLMHSWCMICTLLNLKDFQTMDDDSDEWMIFVWFVCSLNIRESFSQAR